MPLQKKIHPCKKKPLYLTFVHRSTFWGSAFAELTIYFLWSGYTLTLLNRYRVQVSRMLTTIPVSRLVNLWCKNAIRYPGAGWGTVLGAEARLDRNTGPGEVQHSVFSFQYCAVTRLPTLASITACFAGVCRWKLYPTNPKTIHWARQTATL